MARVTIAELQKQIEELTRELELQRSENADLQRRVTREDFTLASYMRDLERTNKTLEHVKKAHADAVVELKAAKHIIETLENLLGRAPMGQQITIHTTGDVYPAQSPHMNNGSGEGMNRDMSLIRMEHCR